MRLAQRCADRGQSAVLPELGWAADGVFVDVGAISSQAMEVAATESATSMAMLQTSMDATAQMMATLLQSLEALQPEGVGGSVNTYG
ncbi:MAG: hypothetical protein JWM90_1597 [Thermoleophilia bacterium]|nr:hypothetical protein [Thermoleophilia bacterium]